MPPTATWTMSPCLTRSAGPGAPSRRSCRWASATTTANPGWWACRYRYSAARCSARTSTRTRRIKSTRAALAAFEPDYSVWGIGYSYPFSIRTSLYVGYAHREWDGSISDPGGGADTERCGFIRPLAVRTGLLPQVLARIDRSQRPLLAAAFFSSLPSAVTSRAAARRSISPIRNRRASRSCGVRACSYWAARSR